MISNAATASQSISIVHALDAQIIAGCTRAILFSIRNNDQCRLNITLKHPFCRNDRAHPSWKSKEMFHTMHYVRPMLATSFLQTLFQRLHQVLFVFRQTPYAIISCKSIACILHVIHADNNFIDMQCTLIYKCFRFLLVTCHKVGQHKRLHVKKRNGSPRSTSSWVTLIDTCCYQHN